MTTTVTDDHFHSDFFQLHDKTLTANQNLVQAPVPYSCTLRTCVRFPALPRLDGQILWHNWLATPRDGGGLGRGL